ncbi:MAG: T9SS type A sorting domain-containing protein, partial [Candidatus Zixiibacteriota bacterium]
MRKMVWIFLSVALVFGLQVGANATAPTTSNFSVTTIANELVPPKPANSGPSDYTVYFYDFEAGMSGWTSYDAGDAGNKWHQDTWNAYAGESWWCGEPALNGYDNHWLQYLMTPSLNFVGVSNPVLTFKLRYELEIPGGEPPPYDGWDTGNVWVSIDGGTNWTVITPTFPAYNISNSYAFGVEWGMGPGIPGWGGQTGGWVDASFDLSPLVGQPDVMIRWAFASDPAYCTIDDPLLLGYFIDNVSIDEDGGNMLTNDCDNPPFPAEFTPTNASATGDYWVLQDASYAPVSPTHAMLCDHAGHYNLSDALESPWISLPAGENLRFKFWLWCNLLDWDGDGNNSLEDYYHVELSTDGVVWQEVFYDYGDDNRPGGANIGWEEYLPGMPYNGNVDMNLSAWAGQDIKLRWRVITDFDDNGGVGDGLYIDDVEIYTEDLNTNDVGTERLHVPMPTSMYFTDKTCTMEVHNYGLANQTMVPAFYRVNGVFVPLIPWNPLPSGAMELKTWSWTMPAVGSYIYDGYTLLSGDEDLSNDTSYAGVVEVTPADVLEFGYDNRQYDYLPQFYYFTFNPGNGPWVRYTPGADGVTDLMNGDMLKAFFYTPGTCTIHIYEGGTPTAPGPEITSFLENVTTTYPAWHQTDISGIAELQGFLDDFWVWYEITDASGFPQPMGWDREHDTGHMIIGGASPTPSDYDWFNRAVFTVGAAGPVWVDLTTVSGSPVSQSAGGTVVWNIAGGNNEPTTNIVDIWADLYLPNGSYYSTIMGPLNNFTMPGNFSSDRDRDLLIPPLVAPLGTYTIEGNIEVVATGYTATDVTTFEVTAPDGIGHTIGDFWCINSGESWEDALVEAGLEAVPDAYSIGEAYPNPFNPTTNISYSLPLYSNVNLAVYDVSGRLVTTLVDGYRDAGVHDVTFDASGLSSGIYVYRLTAGDFTASGKMVLMK